VRSVTVASAGGHRRISRRRLFKGEVSLDRLPDLDLKHREGWECILSKLVVSEMAIFR
jgi:hypothetical protein